jgi:hypothetical protein
LSDGGRLFVLVFFPTALQALECLLGQRFRFCQFGLFVVGSAEANRHESIAFQKRKGTPPNRCALICAVPDAT